MRSSVTRLQGEEYNILGGEEFCSELPSGGDCLGNFNIALTHTCGNIGCIFLRSKAEELSTCGLTLTFEQCDEAGLLSQF